MNKENVKAKVIRLIMDMNENKLKKIAEFFNDVL